MKKTKILILTSNVGSGHLSIARAYEQILNAYLPKTDILTLNTSLSVASWAYRFMTSYFGKFYLKIYNLADNKNTASLLHKIHIVFTVKKVERVIRSFKPDLIISTNSFSASPAGAVLKKRGLKIPIAVVIADPFSIHKIWTVYKDADLYLCPTQNAKDVLVSDGIPENKIAITGWPVRSEFYLKSKKPKTKKVQVLVTSGGEGLSYVRNYLIEVLGGERVKATYFFNVICARNKELFFSLELLRKINPNTMKVFEYVENIYKLMARADIIVGKPGPNFLFESITLAKPFVAIGIPIGQELGNYEFIEKNKIGIYCKDPKEFKRFLLSGITIKKSGIDKKRLKKLSAIQKNTPEKIWSSLKRCLE